MADRVEEISERWSAGTPGPWKPFSTPQVRAVYGGQGLTVRVAECFPSTTRAALDVEKIARAPEDIAWLLAEVADLRRRRDAVAEAIKADVAEFGGILMPPSTNAALSELLADVPQTEATR